VVNIHEPGPTEGRFAQWPLLAVTGALEVRVAETDTEVEQAQELRYRVFYQEMAAIPTPEMRAAGRDFDRFDAVCDHLLVVDRSQHDEDGQPVVVGTYRLMRDEYAKKAGGFYTATEYDIAPMLEGRPRDTRYLELGRSCIVKEYRTKPSTMQLLWRGLMAYAVRFNIDVMFGCASFQGIDPQALAMPLSYLHHFHAMPPTLHVKARPELYVGMDLIAKDKLDPKEALRALPPLMKGYLRAGCRIGDGAVIDRQFSTIDVFIYLPMDDIDPRYKSRFGFNG
jgi:putative hemolysin